MRKIFICLGLVLLSLSACNAGASTTVIPVTGSAATPAEPLFTISSPTTNPPSGASASITELKYRLLDRYPNFFYCDPDFYPVAREDESELAQQRFSEIQANAGEFQAILEHNHLEGATTFDEDQKLLIYRDYKKLAAIILSSSGQNYRFQLQVSDQKGQGFLIEGTISEAGNIDEQQRKPGIATCPICLAAGTLIDTPKGTRPVEGLKTGDPVWTSGINGKRQTAIILQIGRNQAPLSHQVIHLILEDGRELWASPGHPTTDRRTIGMLQSGDLIDGSRVLLTEVKPYAFTYTYDLLPSGETGFYWANGILVASTLSK